jgi:ferric-dicitrate binding protein FerR (iron transport regulator)
MNEIDRLRQQRMQELRDENQAALEQRQRAEAEYLNDMQPTPARREWQLPEPEPPPRRRGARYTTSAVC